MRNISLAIAVFILAAALISDFGCGTSTAVSPQPAPAGATPTVPPTLASRVYVSDDNNPGTIYVYALPITATSTPVSTLAGIYPGAMAFDAAHRLFVSNVLDVRAFTQPISNHATPAFTVNVGENGGDVAVDSSGDLFVSWANQICHPHGCSTYGEIDVFSAPVTGASRTAFTLGTGGNTIAFDPRGDFWTAHGDVKGSYMSEFLPPLSASSTPALEFPIPRLGRIVFDNAGELYAADARGIDVYQPPFTRTTPIAFTISMMAYPEYFAFDASGKLYVTTSAGQLLVLEPPFSSASTPQVTLALFGAPTVAGIAIGP